MISCFPGPVLVSAPHPDDETFGCGGTLLRLRKAGAEIYWMIVTCMDPADGWPADKIERRRQEIERTARQIGVVRVHALDLPTGRLETIPMGRLVGAMKRVVEEVAPGTLLLPNRGDAHSDHRVVFDAGAACAKWFRHGSVRAVLTYETLSETDQGTSPAVAFHPQVFVDVSTTLEAKLDLCRIYADELGAFPFPRSTEAVRALAQVRGAASGFAAAEAFGVVRVRG